MSAVPLAGALPGGNAAPGSRLRLSGHVALLIAAALAIEAAAVIAQAYYGAIGDVSWMITICEKWLDGGTAYVDFIETNPPAAIWLYIPPVAFARLIGARPEMIVAAYGFAAVAGSLAACAAILRRGGLLDRLGPATALLGLVALTILPGRTFGERDFFIALLALPSLALAAVRAERGAVDWRLALLAGLCAGAMVAIKPPYALIVFGAVAVVAARAGMMAVLASLEHCVAATLFAAYVALIVWRFPAYGGHILPIVVAAYLPVRESLAQLLANAAVVVWVGIVGLLALVARDGARVPLVAAPLAGSLGALAAFFIQGKGWLYQTYPALALLLLAVGVAWDASERRGRGFVPAIAATVVAAALLGVPPIDAAALVSLAAASAGLLGARSRALESRARLVRIGHTATAALVAAACVFYSLPPSGPDADFVRAVADLGPHPRLAAIGEGLGIGFPLVREVDGVWVQRSQGLLMTAGARRLIDQHPADQALAARLAPIIAWDRDLAAEDIRRERPDAVLVSDLGPRFHQWAMTDPALRAALAPYRFVMASRAKDWPVDLYVRQDLVGLRPSLASSDDARR